MRCSSLFQFVTPVLLISVACSSSTNPSSAPMSVSFSSQNATTAAPALADVTVTVGTNTLVLSRVQVVIRRIKLTQAASATCADDDSTADSCEETTEGPVLVDVPLTTTTVTSLSAAIPAGTYSKIDFRIHMPTSDARDTAFVAANPNFAHASIRVDGTFNGTAFVFTSALNEKEELEFNPPIVIDGTNKNVTVQLDVSSWFKSGTTIINPTTANPGQPNENVVRNNIRASLRGIEDDGKRGH